MKYSACNLFKDARGFSIIELVFVLVIALVVTSLALIGASRAKENMQMMGAAELVKGSIERAFTDARRRHAGGSDRSQLVVTSTTTYNLTVDLAGDGVPETRTMTLPSGVTFSYNPLSPPKATVDWRGMIAE